MGFERKGSPLLIENCFFLILQAHVTKIGLLEFKSAIAVTRDGLEELKISWPICCRAGNYFVGGYVLLSFLFFTCPCSLLNKYYHFVHGFISGLISEE